MMDTKLLAVVTPPSIYQEVPLYLIIITSDDIIYSEIYPVHNWWFIFDIFDDA